MSLHGLRPFGFQNPWLVLACPEFADIAKEMVETAPRGTMDLGSIQWKVFPDGTPNLKFDAQVIEGRDVIFLGSVRENFLPFFSICYAIPRCLARTFTVICPFFPTGTMERVEKEGEVATAKTLARMMSATPSPQVGDTNFAFFDMHALATRFYFADSIKAHLLTAVPLLQHHLAFVTNHDGSKPVIAFPDEGAKKRFGGMFKDHYEIAYCMKTRRGNRREVVLQEGNIKGKKVFIIDDLVQSGGTLIECKDLMYTMGATSVNAYVTHGVFPRESWRKFLPENTPKGKRPFDEFVLTDSIPSTSRAVKGKAPFRVLSIGDQLVSMLASPKLLSPSKL